LAVSGNLLGRWDAHPHHGHQFAAEFILGWKQDDDLSDPAAAIVTKRAADGTVVRLIKNETVLVVGEPDNELLLLVLSDADFFFRDRFDAETFSLE